MATSLEDETQQPSFYNQLSSPGFGTSPDQSLPFLPPGSRAARPQPPSSPIAESSFLQQQLTRPAHDGEEEEDSLRESALDRQTKAVVSGNLLRVGVAPQASKPGWSTAPPTHLAEAGPSARKSVLPDLGVEEVDELASSPMPGQSPAAAAMEEEESGHIPSPLNSSPPAGPSNRKRKNPPSPVNNPNRVTPSKPPAGHLPISAHSPARPSIFQPKTLGAPSSKPIPKPPPALSAIPPLRPPSRGASKAKKQKVVEESPDSFAGPVHRPIRKASEYFESADEKFQIPKEMQSSGGRTADDDEDEADETDQADKMEVDGQESSAQSGVKDNQDLAEESNGSQGNKQSGESAYAAGLVETYMSQPGRAATPESSHLSASTEDASAPNFPPPRMQDPPPAPSSPSQSLPPAGQTLPEIEHSYFGRPKRGFTNFGMSLTQESPNTSKVHVNRNELFSSPAEGIGSSPSQSQGWSNLPPTQARMLASQSDSGGGGDMGDGMEPTQMVSEESQQRAQVLADERKRTREEEQKERDEWNLSPQGGEADLGNRQISSKNGGRDMEESNPAESVPEVDPGAIGDTQQVSEESIENALEKRRAEKEAESQERKEEEAVASRSRQRQSLHASKSAPETQDISFQSRRSDDQPTQMFSEESHRPEIQTPAPVRPTSPVIADRPAYVIPLHRRLQRRNVIETRSEPQPLAANHTIPTGSVRSRADPAPPPVSRLATPPATPPEPTRQVLPIPSRLPARGLPSPHVSVNVQMASPGIQGPSSSMQEAEDILQLGVITQMSEPEDQVMAEPYPEPSPSPPIRGGSARRSGRTRNRPTIFTPTPDSPAPATKARSSRAAASRPASPTDSDGASEEEAGTLPPPPVVPSPVKTYGTRRTGPNITPAKPPNRHSALATKSKEDVDESPDHLALAIDQPEGLSREDRMDVDEPPEPESPPTPQDTEDYSYRPVLPTRTSVGATSKPIKKVVDTSRKSKSRPDPTPARKVYSAVNKSPSSNLSRPASSTDLSAIVVVDIPGPRVRHNSRSGVAEGSKSSKKAKSAAPVLNDDTSDLSEPESPPTPQDPDDETFKLSKKASEAASKGKKRLSRQTSVLSSTASAGPSKSKPVKKTKKGRGSKLSISTADTGALTPTQTSSTEDDPEDEEEDVSDKPFVLAYFDQMRSYYAAHVLARVGDRYRVKFLDQLSRVVSLDELRQCELKVGDRIKFDKAPMKRKAELEIGKDWSEEGLVSVKDKKGVIGDFDIGEFHIPASTILKLFEDRKISAEVLKNLPEEEVDQEEKEVARKTSSTVVHKVKTGTSTFADKVFLITPTDDTTASLRNTIIKNGGTLCDWGDLFQGVEFGQSIRTDLGRVPFLVTPAEIDGEKSGMKAKSMIALSFGIPCLHHGYIEAALNNPNCDWIPYLLPPGKSAITGLPASQIVDVNWGEEDWLIRNARHLRRPLANKRLLFMDLTPKGVEIRTLVATSAFGLGAISFRVVPSLDNIEEADYDYLILSNCSEKDRKKKEREFPRGVKGNKKACDVKWLKQVMISSTCPPPRLYTY